MRAQDIVNQLTAFLPRVTGRFSDTLTISSITAVGLTITVVTATDHGLSIGDFANVLDVVTPNPITSLTNNGLIATVITGNNHDLVEDILGRDTVTISGAAETDFNGTFQLLTVPSRTSFTYKLLTIPSGSPATGSPILEETFNCRGYNGRHSVLSVPDTTTFTYTIPNFAPLEDGLGGLVRTRHRITRVKNSDAAIAAYTAKATDELWAFVFLGGTEASKDRNTNSDATTEKSAGDDPRQKLIFHATILVFIPATAEISGAAARDLAQSEVMVNIVKSIVGAALPSGYSEHVWGRVTYDGDTEAEFGSKAIYAHAYSITQTADITVFDRIPFSDTVALRQINFSLADPPSDVLAEGEVVF